MTTSGRWREWTAEERRALPLAYASLRYGGDNAEDNPDGLLTKASDFARLSVLRDEGIPDYAPPLFPEEGFPYWVKVWKRRIAEHWDVVLVIDGPEGSSKSTLALRIAFALDPAYNLDRICYTASDVMDRFRDTAAGEVVLFDESARDLLGANASSKEAKLLAQALMLIREKGLTVILCVPRIHELAPSMRARRASYWIHCEKPRGTALVHERSDAIQYQPDPRDLGFRLSSVAPDIVYPKWDDDDPIWAHYIRVKTAHLQAYLRETADLLAGKRKAPSAQGVVRAAVRKVPARIRKALTLLRSGQSYRAVQSATGVALSTLHRWAKKEGA